MLINNDFYETLQDQWYHAKNHPIALLRAENNLRTPWICNELKQRFPNKIDVLDVGCGGGFLTNALALEGHEVTGIDLSGSSLEVARRHDKTQSVQYLQGDAYHLPFEAGTFDCVCAMDILEHVEDPARLIAEASRVLKKDGLFFFHTFNRNLLSYLMVIKGVEWFVQNTPPNMHVYNLFIKPKELKALCTKEQLQVETCLGFRPSLSCTAFWKMLATRQVPSDYTFKFSKSLATGYCGIAIKGKQ